MQAVLDNLDLVFKGFGYTVAVFVLAGLLSTVLGIFLAACRVSPIPALRAASSTWVTLVRNTPLVMVFASFSFTAPQLWSKLNFAWVDVHVGTFDFTSYASVAVIALSLYTSAFVCEAIRSGVNAVPLGQAEAARAVGLPFAGVMTQVVLPQAFRAAVPPYASVQIALIKNTSVAAVFGLGEATAQMRGLTNEHASERLAIFLCFALGYIVLVEIVSFASNRLERRWSVAR